MTDTQRLKGLMGLCVRARRAVFGEDGCLKAIRGGGCCLLLLDEEASPATKEKYLSACRAAGVSLAALPPGLLWEATGRPGKAMAVTDPGFAAKMQTLLPTAQPNEVLQRDRAE